MRTIYIYTNYTNNYTIWYYDDHLLTNMVTTLDTSQDDRSLLNSDAESNIFFMFVTLDTFQQPISVLKDWNLPPPPLNRYSMFVILEVSKQWISSLFPSLIYFNIWSFILELFTNFLSEPQVSAHDDSDDDDDDDGDDVGDDDDDDDDNSDNTVGEYLVETIVGGKEGMGARNKLDLSMGKAVVLLDAWVGV